VPLEVEIEGERIAGVRDLPSSAVPADLWLLPGLVDIQVNGYGGHDLNGPEVDIGVVAALVHSLQARGVTRFCPTICTQSRERMEAALRAVAAACRADPRIARAVAGIHLEGPYISPEDGPRGAHPRQHVRPPDWAEFETLQQTAEGRVRLVTLAPEWPGAETFIRRLVDSAVVAAIGHTAASPEVIRQAVRAGARLSTHLGNGSHAMLPRHPNYIWEQLAADDLWASIIVDGHHLPPAVVKTFVRAKGIQRTILISDAVALAGMAPGDYDWMGMRVTLSPEGRISLSGTPYLAGSALDLASALPRVMAFARLTLADAVTMASANPARLLGIEVGTLAPGGPADLVLMRIGDSGQVDIVQTIAGGQVVWEAA
jgi:N-acetylglucosamine-6-phosphate deacetylase